VRSDTAVTGEITLRGHILPVGGIRDKASGLFRSKMTSRMGGFWWFFSRKKKYEPAKMVIEPAKMVI